METTTTTTTTTTINNSESGPHSYGATKAFAKKVWKKILRVQWDTGAMLYQLSYEALLDTGQKRVQFTPINVYEVSVNDV